MRDKDWNDFQQGLSGIPTGSPINQEGLYAGGHAERPGMPPAKPAPLSPPSGQGLRFVRAIMDGIPWWLHPVCAALGLGGGFYLASLIDPAYGLWRLVPVGVCGYLGWIAPTVITGTAVALVAFGLFMGAVVLGIYLVLRGIELLT